MANGCNLRSSCVWENETGSGDRMSDTWYNTGENTWGSLLCSLSARLFSDSVCLSARILSPNPTFFTFVFLCFSPQPCHQALVLFLYAHPHNFSSQPPFSPLTVILSSHPSFFYSCCQISLSTLGKLHFSDYTPIKGPIGTQFACCSLSLETEKWTVSMRVCVCVCVCVCARAQTCKAERAI